MNQEQVQLTKSSGNIFQDLGFSYEEAESLRLRTLLLLEIERSLKRQPFSVPELANQLGMTASQVNELLTGTLDQFTIETLLGVLWRIGSQVEIIVRPRPVTVSGTESIIKNHTRKTNTSELPVSNDGGLQHYAGQTRHR